MKYRSPGFVNGIIHLHGIDNFLFIIYVMKIERKCAEGAHLGLEVRDEDRVDRVYYLYSLQRNAAGSIRILTVFIPRLPLPAFSSPCMPRTAYMSVCLSGCLSIVGWSSASFSARKSSPRLPVACCAVHVRWPHTARRTATKLLE